MATLPVTEVSCVGLLNTTLDRTVCKGFVIASSEKKPVVCEPGGKELIKFVVVKILEER